MASPRSNWFRWSAAAISGAGIAFSQPGYFLPAGSAGACLIPLLWAIADAPGRQRLVLGWGAGTLGTLSVLSEGSFGSYAYFGLSNFASISLALLIAQAFGAATFALFAWLAGTGGAVGLRRIVQTMAALSLAESLRSSVDWGLPWMLTAYSFADVPFLVAPARWFGATGVSALAAGAAASLLCLARPRERLAGGVMLAVIALVWWSPNLRSVETSVARNLTVRAIQTEFPGERQIADFSAELAEVASRSVGTVPDLVVWPESSVSVLMPENAPRVSGALQASGVAAPVLFGATRLTPSGALRNSTFLLDADRGVRHFVDKVRLLPLGEFSPFGFERLSPRGGSMTAGPMSTIPLRDDVIIGVLSCYEVLFSDLARHLAAAGATMLINPSNEVWLGHAGREQQRAAAILRAVEVGLPLVRATNSGRSGAFSATGQPLSSAAESDATVVLQPSRTPFSRFGGWLPGCYAAVWALSVCSTIRSRSRRRA